MLRSNKELEVGDSDSGLKTLKKSGKTTKDLADIVNTVWQDFNSFEKFKTKMKTYQKIDNSSDLIVKKKEIWQERMNTQVHNKDLKSPGEVLNGAPVIFKVTKNLINLKNNKDIPDK